MGPSGKGGGYGKAGSPEDLTVAVLMLLALEWVEARTVKLSITPKSFSKSREGTGAQSTCLALSGPGVQFLILKGKGKSHKGVMPDIEVDGTWLLKGSKDKSG